MHTCARVGVGSRSVPRVVRTHGLFVSTSGGSVHLRTCAREHSTAQHGTARHTPALRFVGRARAVDRAGPHVRDVRDARMRVQSAERERESAEQSRTEQSGAHARPHARRGRWVASI
ncbi:hypothetical protein HETIRDRAFT_454493 [Heterobasidion irregulare TC 32-1]|uniref:Uncharacterized protein n=1 Tax=Heterobasidion irregulare (strain TC 32-1) TaxID=747525 RepID=W4JW39_HETIT|nr:uncharacterized protein HETIRDRAFT_454493 [Heterobasidion irregulare TC 32-1]ETW77101.1 hypothetical protein HETIRDRAFT_454493 [Heterobasidion irregulare TC 32-1]